MLISPKPEVFWPRPRELRGLFDFLNALASAAAGGRLARLEPARPMMTEEWPHARR